MDNPDAYYRKKYWWRPWKKWAFLRKIRKDARKMTKYLDYVREQVDYWNKARCEDCIDYHQSKSDAEKLLTGTCLINTLMMTIINNIIGFTSFVTMDLYTMYEHLLGRDVDKDTGRGYGIRPIVENMKDEELNEELKSLCSKWNLYRKEIDKGNKNFCGIRTLLACCHRDARTRSLSKHRIEEHDYLNWLKANRKVIHNYI